MILRRFLLAGLVVAIAVAALGQPSANEPSSAQLDQFLTSSLLKGRTDKAPALDAKRIINESNSFLKEREPEMNPEELALYEKIVTMLGPNPELAVKLLEAMMNEKEPPSPAFEFILGNAYYSAGVTDKAEARYRSALKRYPNFLRAWNNLGVLYYTAGRYADAIPTFSKSITLGDRDPTTFGLLGYSLEKQEDYVGAELAFMQAVNGDPANADWREGLFRICLQNQQYGRAEALVKNLIRAHPREARYWLAYAGVLLAANRRVDAIVLLESAASTGVAGIEELTLLGDLYAEQKMTPEALTAFQRLRALSAVTGESRLLAYAQLLLDTGRLADVRAVLASLPVELTPAGRLKLLQTRADLCAAQQQWPEARAELQALLKLAPLNGHALLGLGRAYAAENDLARAAFAFEDAKRSADTRYLANLELATLEIRNRHYGKSVDYLQQALSIEKTEAVENYLSRVKILAAEESHSAP